MGATCVAPLSAIAFTVALSWAGESVRKGMIGAISTPQEMPASFRVRQTSRRFCGLGVPGSSSRHMSRSTNPTETFDPTSARSAASCSRSTSRRISEPFVRMENGLAWSRSTERMPRISLYRPSAR